MSSAAHSEAPSLADVGILTQHADKAGQYLTDGVDLYRYLGAFPGAMGQMVGLENCRSLDVTLWPIGELRKRQLRTVIPVPGK